MGADRGFRDLVRLSGNVVPCGVAQRLADISHPDKLHRSRENLCRAVRLSRDRVAYTTVELRATRLGNPSPARRGGRTRLLGRNREQERAELLQGPLKHL